MTKDFAERILVEFQSDKPYGHIRRTNMAATLNYFAQLCAANALMRGFHDDERMVVEGLDKGCTLNETCEDEKVTEYLRAWLASAALQAELARQASEIGEAVEAVRNPGPDSHCPEFPSFLIEQADVLIRVGDTCGKRELPLGDAVVAKLLYNCSRPYKHNKLS